MEKLLTKAKKIWEISERIIMVGVGTAAVFIGSQNNPNAIKLTALGLGALCIVAGFIPMLVAYAKAVWKK